jgi:hypothetical protein
MPAYTVLVRAVRKNLMKQVESSDGPAAQYNVTRWLQALDDYVVHVNNLSHGTVTHTGRLTDIRQKHDQDATVRRGATGNHRETT